jgi:hypothetical protein
VVDEGKKDEVYKDKGTGLGVVDEGSTFLRVVVKLLLSEETNKETSVYAVVW